MEFDFGKFELDPAKFELDFGKFEVKPGNCEVDDRVDEGGPCAMINELTDELVGLNPKLKWIQKTYVNYLFYYTVMILF